MHYVTLFDFAQQSYPWQALLPFGGFVLLGILLIVFAEPAARFNTRRAFKSPQAMRVFGSLLTAFALLLTVLAYRSTTTQYATYHHLLATHAATTVEGQVTLFSPLPADGKGYESFYVDNIFFAYTPFDDDLAFHQASATKGILANGVGVRVTYVASIGRSPLTANKILRLEVQSNATDQN